MIKMAQNISAAFSIDPIFLEGLLNLVKQTFHGQVIIISQNFRVVQVERRENFQPEELSEKSLGLNQAGFNPGKIKDKILQALKGLEFGQVILVIKKGRLVQIERMQKERYSDLMGLEGEGI
jgi:hypothetical protein